ncbi:ABC transporter permease [Biostraticola tofi]|uniref:Amino acid ABC transporter membrane protein 1 (PAAT family) n=1 Tax=Biostraticola tofi TaxID=466109 RepID=A0A4R3Z093_9GAMM|nr:ABC transporter permease subunit [Biostraticola tofi]TCV98346.1 amino acid ABC transporter membrane protein 1 (PAAT family) [Biostraticola tofi]
MEPVSFWQLVSFGEQGWGPLLLSGMMVTIALSLSGFVLSAAIGALMAWAKISGNKAMRVMADIYTTVLRGIPDLLVIYLFYFGGSSVLSAVGRMFNADGFIAFPGFLAGMMAVGITAGAQQTEVFRGAYRAIAPGELEAAIACGMSRATRFRRILAPLALRFALPSMGNVWQLVLKESALISVTGVAELLTQAQTGSGSTGRPFDFFIAAALLYLLISAFSGWSLRKAESYYSRGAAR